MFQILCELIGLSKKICKRKMLPNIERNKAIQRIYKETQNGSCDTKDFG